MGIIRSGDNGIGTDLVSPAVGIQLVVAEKLPDVAVKLVSSGLEGSADNAALEITEFGRGVLGDQVEFLDGIRSRSVPQ